jgi:hypothetical protein
MSGGMVRPSALAVLKMGQGQPLRDRCLASRVHLDEQTGFSGFAR